MNSGKLLLAVWMSLLLIFGGCAGDFSENISMKPSRDEVSEVVDWLRKAPFWFDLAQSPVDGSLDTVTKSRLEELGSCYAAIANHGTDVIRAAEREYMCGATDDEKVLMNRNLNVLNRYLFCIAWPASYPIDPHGGLKILAASPFVNSLETNALDEFDAFAKEYARRGKVNRASQPMHGEEVNPTRQP